MKTGKRRRVRKKVYQQQEHSGPKSIRDVIDSMEDTMLPATATPAPLPSAGVTVTRNLVGKDRAPFRSGEKVGSGKEINQKMM